MTEIQQLLAAYVEEGSETAFRELVSRYLNLVYSTALRLAGGNAHLAQDVAQTVFLQLAQNARKLSRESSLGGWLHRTTCNMASKAMRTERRRLERETQAMLMNTQTQPTEARMETIAPMLDEAINQLGEEDRKAILLRFYEAGDFRTVGMALGSNEDAARMRVNRALEKLQGILKRKGVAYSTAALGTLLTTGAVNAAPNGLALTVSGVALANAAGGVGATVGVIQFMTSTKLGIAGAIVIAGLAGGLVLKQQQVTELRAQYERQKRQLEEQQLEIEALKQKPQPTVVDRSLSDDERTELLRLRGQMGLMRDQLATSKRKQETLNDSYQMVVRELDKEIVAKAEKAHLNQIMMDAKQWLVAFHLYAAENNDSYPTAFEQAKDFLGEERGSEILKKISGQFELFPMPELQDSSRTDLVILRGNAMQLSSGMWLKVYGFADGHVEALDSVDGDFRATEAARKLVYPPRLE